mgnify:FL=1
MHRTTLLALFCTIVIICIGVNDGAPVLNVKADAAAKPANLPGKT